MTSQHQKGYLFKSILLVVIQIFSFQIAHLAFQQQDGFAADGGLSVLSKKNAASCDVSSIESDQSELTLTEGEEATITITVACKSGDLPEGIKVTARIKKGKNSIFLSSKSKATDVNGDAKFTVTARKKGIARIVFKAGRLKAKVWTKEDGIRLQPSDAGLESGSVVADISVIKPSDDTYRAYFAINEGIRSATSDDGLTFTVEDGFRLPEGYGMPRVVRLGETAGIACLR